MALAAPVSTAAHEVPASATVLAFVHPEADRLRIVLRVPLASMRDVEFPLRGPGYLDLAATEPLLIDASRLWLADYLQLYEDDAPLPEEQVLAARVSLPSDRSFTRYESALAHVRGANLPTDTELVLEQALLDVLLEVPISSARARFSIRPAFAHLGLRTTTVLRFLPPSRGERVFRYDGDPGVVRLDPRWHQAMFRFIDLGFRHILGGLDHLLFVFCLVIPFRRLRPLVVVITSFTVAHSLTLAAAALGLPPRALWFPPLIETLIALSIVYMAFENIVGAQLQRRWMFAFGFGLIHGFGFSFFLQESLQFAGRHLWTSLLAFNVGVELGQLLVILLAVPVLELGFRKVDERIGTILLSALVAHTAWHWMTARGADLLEYRFEWPAMDAALLAAAMRWLMLALTLVGVAWLLRSGVSRWAERRPSEPGLGVRASD